MGSIRIIAILGFVFALTINESAYAQYGQNAIAPDVYQRQQAIEAYQRELAMAYAAQQRAQNVAVYPGSATPIPAYPGGNPYGVQPAGYPQVSGYRQVPVDPHYAVQADRARRRLAEEMAIAQEHLAQRQQPGPFPHRLPITGQSVGFRRQQEDPFGENQAKNATGNQAEVKPPVQAPQDANQFQNPERPVLPQDPFGEKQTEPTKPLGGEQSPITNPNLQPPQNNPAGERTVPGINPFAEPPVEDPTRTQPRVPQQPQDRDPFGEGQVKPPEQVPGRDPITSPEQMPDEIVLPPEIVNPTTQQPPTQQPPAQQPRIEPPATQQPPTTDPRSVEPQVIQQPTAPRDPQSRQPGLESPGAVPMYGPLERQVMPAYPPAQLLPAIRRRSLIQRCPIHHLRMPHLRIPHHRIPHHRINRQRVHFHRIAIRVPIKASWDATASSTREAKVTICWLREFAPRTTSVCMAGRVG